MKQTRTNKYKALRTEIEIDSLLDQRVNFKYQDCLNIMCQRCINHSQCLGTGCQPKKDLQELIDKVVQNGL